MRGHQVGGVQDADAPTGLLDPAHQGDVGGEPILTASSPPTASRTARRTSQTEPQPKAMCRRLREPTHGSGFQNITSVPTNG